MVAAFMLEVRVCAACGCVVASRHEGQHAVFHRLLTRLGLPAGLPADAGRAHDAADDLLLAEIQETHAPSAGADAPRDASRAAPLPN